MSEVASWYYVGTFGQLGPLTLEQMNELIEGSVIEKGTYVWKPGMNDWLPAGNIVEFMSTFKLIEPLTGPPPTPGPQIPPAPTQATSSYVPPMVAPQVSRPVNSPVPTFVYNRQLMLPRSDKNRTAAGLLQLFVPGLGRMYLGYAALGVIQLMVTILTCGIAWLWSVIDGIMILSGQVRIDGYGRALED